jgi:hypothetical protein
LNDNLEEPRTIDDREIEMTTISNAADHATDQVKDAASHVRGTLLEFSTQVLKLINRAREAEGRGVDSVLHGLGLERRRSALGPVLWFAAGAVAAGTAVLLTSPTSGQKLRKAIASFVGQEIEAVGNQADAMMQRAEHAVKAEARDAKAPANGAKRELG